MNRSKQVRKSRGGCFENAETRHKFVIFSHGQGRNSVATVDSLNFLKTNTKVFLQWHVHIEDWNASAETVIGEPGLGFIQKIHRPRMEIW
jgi:hypothetical protein